uniref:Ribosomal protein S6 kinase 2 beta n=1 Tax=Caligus rogercresseyi TaxID=217165 RepID=C1BMX1_CALRO|nr:Ribosomal protein S6 kinase 2 beta [Caligus rogercresseyi]
MAIGRFSVIPVDDARPLEPLFPSSSSNKDTFSSSSSSLDGFIYKRTLGEGGYGKVYLASYGSKVFAIKVAQKRFSGKPTDEFLTLSKANHPFIVKLHHHHIGLQKEYFVLEFCGGGDMRTLLSRVSFFQESQAAFYGSEILSALTYLHTSLSTAFRDLKPSNILVDARGHIKLTDFGLSLPLSRKKALARLSGTTEYMSPEAFISEGPPHHVKEDIWAFGVLLYELLLGKRPFDGPSKSATITNILKLNYDLSSLNGGLSHQAKAVLSDIFVMEADRIESANDVFAHSFFDAYRLSPNELSSLSAPFDPMLRSKDDLSHFELSSFEDDDKRILCQ